MSQNKDEARCAGDVDCDADPAFFFFLLLGDNVSAAMSEATGQVWGGINWIVWCGKQRHCETEDAIPVCADAIGVTMPLGLCVCTLFWVGNERVDKSTPKEAKPRGGIDASNGLRWGKSRQSPLALAKERTGTAGGAWGAPSAFSTGLCPLNKQWIAAASATEGRARAGAKLSWANQNVKPLTEL